MNNCHKNTDNLQTTHQSVHTKYRHYLAILKNFFVWHNSHYHKSHGKLVGNRIFLDNESTKIERKNNKKLKKTNDSVLENPLLEGWYIFSMIPLSWKRIYITVKAILNLISFIFIRTARKYFWSTFQQTYMWAWSQNGSEFQTLEIYPA